MPEYEIRVWVDVLAARSALKKLAGELGFPSRETTELAIVASELGSNIIKYGRHGRLTFRALEAGHAKGNGVAVVARDYGPQFHDLATAMLDGCDDRGPIDPMQFLSRQGIGGGLGAVLRLTHSFAVHPLADGKEIVVERFLKPGKTPRSGAH
jgi:anti-sigma regulatory factor (Ser/Thr protein kinase)